MKKLLLICIFCVGALYVTAQETAIKCPPANNQEMVVQTRANALDFTTTFTDGTQANLFTTLNAGNIVVLDFFYTT